MELKLTKQIEKTAGTLSSNCTFMELKYKQIIITSQIRFVLIVPLWNWNISEVWINLRIDSSNCTFMELKYDIVATRSVKFSF